MALISYWAFDGDSGADSVGSNTLTKEGTTSAVEDSPIYGQTHSVGFAGAGRYQLASPTGLSFASAMTVMGFFKFNALDNGFTHAFSEDDAANYESGQRRSGVMGSRAEVGGTNRGLNSTYTVESGVWKHYAKTVTSGGDTAIYIDGVKDASASLGDVTTGYGATPYLVFGAKNNGGTSSYTGQLAGWALYDEALDDDAIAAVFAAAQAPDDTAMRSRPNLKGLRCRPELSGVGR